MKLNAQVFPSGWHQHHIEERLEHEQYGSEASEPVKQSFSTITPDDILIIELNESIVYTMESRRWNKISNSFNCSYPGSDLFS